jgi:hypothetical protein
MSEYSYLHTVHAIRSGCNFTQSGVGFSEGQHLQVALGIHRTYGDDSWHNAARSGLANHCCRSSSFKTGPL